MKGSKQFWKTLLLVVFCFSSEQAWTHEGVIHSEGDEQHPKVQILRLVDPDLPFRVALAQLPDQPFVGQEVQFLLRLEEILEIPDPLLGEHAPLIPRALEVRLEGSQSAPLILQLEETGESGVFEFRHVFADAQTWKLNLEFEDDSGRSAQGELDIGVRAAPTNWPLLALQGMVLVFGLGWIAQRLLTAGPAYPVVSSAAIALLVLGCFFLLGTVWPSNIPVVSGLLEVTALANADTGPDSEKVEELPQTISKVLHREGSQSLVGVVRYAPDRIAQILNPFPGVIQYPENAPSVGDHVKAGQILAKVENRFNMHDYVHLFPERWVLVKELLALQEQEVLAQAEYERAAHLLDLGAISRREFQHKELEYNRLSKELESATDRQTLLDSQIRQNQLKITEIPAPISGQITRAVYSSGQIVYEGDPLFEIVDLSQVWVEAKVLPQNLGDVEKTREVELFSSATGSPSLGRLVQVSPGLDPVSRTIKVLYTAKNPDYGLREGMLVDVVLKPTAIPVPEGGPAG